MLTLTTVSENRYGVLALATSTLKRLLQNSFEGERARRWRTVVNVKKQADS